MKQIKFNNDQMWSMFASNGGANGTYLGYVAGYLRTKYRVTEYNALEWGENYPTAQNNHDAYLVYYSISNQNKERISHYIAACFLNNGTLQTYNPNTNYSGFKDFFYYEYVYGRSSKYRYHYDAIVIFGVDK